VTQTAKFTFKLKDKYLIIIYLQKVQATPASRQLLISMFDRNYPRCISLFTMAHFHFHFHLTNFGESGWQPRPQGFFALHGGYLPSGKTSSGKIFVGKIFVQAEIFFFTLLRLKFSPAYYGLCIFKVIDGISRRVTFPQYRKL